MPIIKVFIILIIFLVIFLQLYKLNQKHPILSLICIESPHPITFNFELQIPLKGKPLPYIIPILRLPPPPSEPVECVKYNKDFFVIPCIPNIFNPDPYTPSLLHYPCSNTSIDGTFTFIGSPFPHSFTPSCLGVTTNQTTPTPPLAPASLATTSPVISATIYTWLSS